MIVVQELLEDRLQLTAAKDQQVIEQLPASGAHPSFRDRVRPRRAERKVDHFHAFAVEDLIEAGRELSVPIAEQKVGFQRAILQLPGKVAGLLDHPLAAWMSAACSSSADGATLQASTTSIVQRSSPSVAIHCEGYRARVGNSDAAFANHYDFEQVLET